MAQILAPSPQWQMRIPNNSTNASLMTSKMWGSLLLKHNKKATTKSSAKFRAFAMLTENNAVNRIEDLLNMDVAPYTDKIIAEYIWYILLSLADMLFMWFFPSAFMTRHVVNTSSCLFK